MPLIIIYDLRKNKAPDKFFPRKSRICQGLKIYFQMFMKKMEEFRVDLLSEVDVFSHSEAFAGICKDGTDF